MKRSKIASLLVMALVGLVSQAVGRAAGPPPVRNVEVTTGAYKPYAIIANEGDTITWTSSTRGGSVVAYKGATFDSASEYPVNGMQPHDTFSWTYTGGEVLYRSTGTDPANKPWSTVDADGNCSGMCGRITDTPPPDMTGAPVFTAPAVAGSPAIVASHWVTFSGTVTGDATKILLFRDGTAFATIEGVSGGTWSGSFDLMNGTYTLTAIAVHSQGFWSGKSDPITFTVNADDVEPPSVLIDAPREQLILSAQLQVSAILSDDVSIAPLPHGVDIVVVDKLTGTEYRPDSIRCLQCGVSGNHVQAYASMTLGPGMYTITVTAMDKTLKTGKASKDVIVAL